MGVSDVVPDRHTRQNRPLRESDQAARVKKAALAEMGQYVVHHHRRGISGFARARPIRPLEEGRDPLAVFVDSFGALRWRLSDENWGVLGVARGCLRKAAPHGEHRRQSARNTDVQAADPRAAEHGNDTKNKIHDGSACYR